MYSTVLTTVFLCTLCRSGGQTQRDSLHVKKHTSTVGSSTKKKKRNRNRNNSPTPAMISSTPHAHNQDTQVTQDNQQDNQDNQPNKPSQPSDYYLSGPEVLIITDWIWHNFFPAGIALNKDEWMDAAVSLHSSVSRVRSHVCMICHRDVHWLILYCMFVCVWVFNCVTEKPVQQFN